MTTSQASRSRFRPPRTSSLGNLAPGRPVGLRGELGLCPDIPLFAVRAITDPASAGDAATRGHGFPYALMQVAAQYTLNESEECASYTLTASTSSPSLPPGKQRQPGPRSRSRTMLDREGRHLQPQTSPARQEDTQTTLRPPEPHLHPPTSRLAPPRPLQPHRR